jgi:hypothetical protein
MHFSKKSEAHSARRHFQRFSVMPVDFCVDAGEGNSQSLGEIADEAVFFLGFFSQSVIDVKDDESFGGISLFAALCHQKGERHRIGTAAYRQPDAS